MDYSTTSYTSEPVRVLKRGFERRVILCVATSDSIFSNTEVGDS